MGLTIECKKTGRNYDLSYNSFNRLRERIAELCSPEFGKHYRTLRKTLLSGTDNARFFEEFDEKTADLLEKKLVHIKIVDFCLQSDYEGKIHYGTCKKIYRYIKDCDDDTCYGYAAYPNHMTFENFKSLLLECYENKSDLIWK